LCATCAINQAILLLNAGHTLVKEQAKTSVKTAKVVMSLNVKRETILKEDTTIRIMGARGLLRSIIIINKIIRTIRVIKITLKENLIKRIMRDFSQIKALLMATASMPLLNLEIIDGLARLVLGCPHPV
jgi:hypothetical protein